MANSRAAVVDCPRCEAHVNGQVRGEYEHYDPDVQDVPQRVQLVECPKCGGPLVVGYEYYGGEHWEGPYRIYPSREKGLSLQVPKRIRAAFEEAQRAFRARCYTAAAIMCRKTLEGITSDQGAGKKNLAAALKVLKDQGIIDERLYEWSEMLRVTGNEAAHGVETTISPEDAEDALQFTEAIADYLYVFKQRFESFKERRTATAGAKASPLLRNDDGSSTSTAD